jgi:hypothetical protein
MSPLPLKKTPLVKAERNLERLEKLIELFEPFILLNEHDFAADNVEKLSQALVEEEREDFWIQGANARLVGLLDQCAYSGAAKWTYPLIEGRPLEARPARSFSTWR